MKKTIAWFTGIIISILATIAGVANFASFDFLSAFIVREPTLGTTVTTITGATLVSNFPTIYNANLNALNADKLEISAFAATTSMQNLAVVGTITSGTWNGSTITGAYGGTGSSSLSTNYVMLGNGATGLKTVVGLGATGEVLTSAGAGAPPVWGSAAVNDTLDYDWTGHHTFTSLYAILASSTHATTTTSWGFGTLNYRPPTGYNASSTVLSTDAAGKLTWSQVSTLAHMGSFLGATTTDESVNDTITETTLGTGPVTTIPGGTMGTNGAVRVKVYVGQYQDGGANTDGVLRIKFGATEVCSITFPTAANSARMGFVTFDIYSNGSASSQLCLGSMALQVSGSAGISAYSESSSSVDTSTDQVISATWQWGGNDGGDTETFTMGSMFVENVGYTN